MNSEIGEICERGYLNGFKRRGFTPEKCIQELAANTMDAFDAYDHYYNKPIVKRLTYEILKREISFIDNAIGMDDVDLKNLFAMHRENHSNDKSRGVSGIGAKPAMSILSNETPVKISTWKAGSSKGYTIIIPWDKIHSEGRYTGMMTGLIKEMTEEEKRVFYKQREGLLNENGETHGTTITFLSNNTLRELIHRNFASIHVSEKIKKGKKEIKSKLNMNPLDRIGCVFGRDKVEIRSYDYEKGKATMNMYNYFGESPEEYYMGISTYVAEHWYSEEKEDDRFIWRHDSKMYEILKKGQGYSTKINESTVNMDGYKRVDDYVMKVGLRYDKTIFDYENPIPITAQNIKCAYNDIHIGNDDTFLASTRLVRNGQIIGIIHPETTISNARGSGESYFNTLLIQSELLSNPLSKQKTNMNHQDRIFNIQENKGILNPDSQPKNLTRLIKAMKIHKANEIWNIFENKLKEKEVEEVEEVEEEEVEVVPEVPVEPVVPEVIPEVEEVEEVEEVVPVVPVPVVPVVPEVKEVPVEPVVPEVIPEVPEVPVPEVKEVPDIKKEPKPTDVRPFRRGGVSGKEILEEFQRISAQIDSTTIYMDTYIELYNHLKNL